MMICAFCNKHDRESAGSWVCSECLLKFDSQRQKVLDSIRDCQHWVWLDNRLQEDGICGTEGIFCQACRWKIDFFNLTKDELVNADVYKKPFCDVCGTRLINYHFKFICPKCTGIQPEPDGIIAESPVMVPVSSPESLPVQVSGSDNHIMLEDEPEIHNSPDRPGKLFVKCLTEGCDSSFNLDVDDGGLVISKSCPKCGQENFKAVNEDIKAFM